MNKEELLNKKIDVLDHGFVQLIDCMGSDQRIVEAARVSISGEKVRATTDDRNLIRYLVRHHHSTPLEQVKFTFCVKAPLLVVAQWRRHRTSQFSSENEMSARYSVLPEEYYVPDRICQQSKNNKQGSGQEVDNAIKWQTQTILKKHSKQSFAYYKQLLEDYNVARELSRSVLPVNTYTQFYVSVDLWNLCHFLRLRLDAHAQWEIRQYAQAMYELIKPVCPLSMEAFDDYILNSKSFSANEMKLLKVLIGERISSFTEEEIKEVLGSKREVDEFLGKLK